MSWEVIEADCVEQMRQMDEASVDAIVTDPPYGLEFMGKEWDSLNHGAAVVDDPASVGGYQDPGGGNAYSKARIRYGQGDGTGRAMQQWHQAWATEALRVLKPGGHLLAFGGTRTYHRLACAVEDAGFEIRDTICWLYGSGFPKSLDVSKAIDKAAGAKREVVGSKLGQPGYSLAENKDDRTAYGAYTDAESESQITAPATPEAAQWEGWGTALKPAHEPIVVARKPLVGTVAANVTEHGMGALNIDATRIRADASSMSACRGGDNNGGNSPSRESSLSLHTLRTLLVAASAELPDPHSRLVASDLAHAVGHRPVPDSQDGCLTCSRCGDALVRLGEEVAQESAPSPLDAHSVLSRQWLVGRIHELQCDDHPSTWDALGRIVDSSDTVYLRERLVRPQIAREDNAVYGKGLGVGTQEEPSGRWPANVALDPEAAAMLDEQSGELTSGKPGIMRLGENTGAAYGAESRPPGTQMSGIGDSGGASRFFYVAKASRTERTVGVGANAHPT